MSGFVTSYLPDFPGDWICVEDFCGSWTGFDIRTPLNITAWWSPSRKETHFGGHWLGTPPMPSDEAPDEDSVWAWAKGADTPWAHRHAFHTRKRASREDSMKAIETRFREKGYNWATATVRQADGTETVTSGCVGLRSKLDMLRCICASMQTIYPRGACLTRLVFEEGLSQEEVERRRARDERLARKRRTEERAMAA